MSDFWFYPLKIDWFVYIECVCVCVDCGDLTVVGAVKIFMNTHKIWLLCESSVLDDGMLMFYKSYETYVLRSNSKRNGSMKRIQNNQSEEHSDEREMEHWLKSMRKKGQTKQQQQQKMNNL